MDAVNPVIFMQIKGEIAMCAKLNTVQNQSVEKSGTGIVKDHAGKTSTSCIVCEVPEVAACRVRSCCVFLLVSQ